MTSTIGTRLIAFSETVSRISDAGKVTPTTAAQSFASAGRRLAQALLPDKFAAGTAVVVGERLRKGAPLTQSDLVLATGADSLMFAPVCGLGWDAVEVVPQFVLALRDVAVGLGQLATGDIGSPPGPSDRNDP